MQDLSSECMRGEVHVILDLGVFDVDRIWHIGGMNVIGSRGDQVLVYLRQSCFVSQLFLLFWAPTYCLIVLSRGHVRTMGR